MPPRARRGNRLLIERELSKSQLVAIKELCRLIGIPPARWQNVAALQASFETGACAALAERIRLDEGQTWEAALTTAAIRLDLEPETLQSRLYRWQREGYRVAEPDEVA